MRRVFEVNIYVEGESLGTAVIELDQAVIDNVDDDFRESLYPLYTPEDIAEHIAYNLIVNDIPLTMMDGWANLSDDMARILEYPDQPDYDLEAKEIL